MVRGLDTKNIISYADIIKSCKDIQFYNMNSVEGKHMVHFITGGYYFLKTYQNCFVTNRGQKNYHKIRRGKVYCCIVKPDTTLSALVIEFHGNNIIDDYYTNKK